MATPYNELTKPQKTELRAQFWNAVNAGNIDDIRTIIDRGFPFKDSVNQGATALSTAAQKGYFNIVQLLWERGAGVNKSNPDGTTPLLRAAKFGKADVVSLLLLRGAKINHQDGTGQTALHHAVNYSQFEVVAMLCDRGANVAIEHNGGRTPFVAAILKKWTQGAVFLLDAGSDANGVFDYNGHPFTMLGLAIELRMKELADRLIDKVADVNVKYGRDNVTAIIHLGHVDWVDSVIKILNKGADINAAASNGVTALMEASVDGRLEMMTLLIDRGANINAVTPDRLWSALYDAINMKQVDASLLLIERGADVNVATSAGRTPLMRAAASGLPEVASALIRKGANVDAKDIEFGKTALMYAAAMNDDITVGVLLIEGNAKKDITDNEGQIAADYTTDEELREALKAVVQDVPWKGQTRGDIEIFDTFFEDVINWSFCPICLGYAQRSEACRYMHHKCKSKPGTFPHRRLYNMYKTEEGNVYWCTICGRICMGHRHFPLTPHQAEQVPALVPLVPGADYFGADEECIKDGGGGTPEKIKRFERLLAWTRELQDQVGVIGNREARAQLVEEAWNGPMLQINTAAILAARRFTTTAADFPAEQAPVAAAEPEGPPPDVPKPADEVANVPEEVEEGLDALEIDIVTPAIRFIHKKKDGTVYRHTDEQLIGKEGLTKYIRTMNPKFGTDEFGLCFASPECDAKLWPQDVQPYITEPEVFEEYKLRFNQKFGAQQGGATGTTPIVYLIEDSSCALKEKIPTEKFSPDIIEVVKTGDLPYIQQFIRDGISVDDQDSDGNTALMHAVIMGNRAIVEMLIAAGANPNVQNKEGKAPVTKAFELGDTFLLFSAGPTIVPKGTVPASKTVYDVSGQTEVPTEDFLLNEQDNAVIIYAGNKVMGFQRGELVSAYGDKTRVADAYYSLPSMLIPLGEMMPLLTSKHPYWKVEKRGQSQEKDVYSIVPVTVASGGTRGKTYRKRKASRKSRA